LKNFPQEN